MNKLRIIIADDERPAREFLKSILRGFEEVEIVGEAENGADAIELIKSAKPDLALLDLQMPEVSGLEVVRLLRKSQMPLVAFVTAYDEYAIQAFEVNAVDYLLKPVEYKRLRETITRAQDMLEQADFREHETERVKAAAAIYHETTKDPILQRIPIKHRDTIVLLPVEEIVSIVADGELLNITTINDIRYTINFRLKDLEARLDPAKFIRLSRGTLVDASMIAYVQPQPGGTYLVTLKNNQQLGVSRLQARIFRNQYLKL